jgi:flagellin-specific chaperone FliS
MLLDAALQAARKAEQLIIAHRPLTAGPELSRAESILTAVISGMRKEAAPQLVDRASSVYAFIARRLTDAHLNDDVVALRDALRVLEFEHETWRLLCERSAVAAAPAPHLPSLGSIPTHADYAAGGFSAEV